MEDDDDLMAGPPRKPASADEVQPLKRFSRESLPVSRLSEGELAGIAAAEVPAESHDTTLPPRQCGQLKGKMWIADNFDEFDEELEKLFYGDDT